MVLINVHNTFVVVAPVIGKGWNPSRKMTSCLLKQEMALLSSQKVNYVALNSRIFAFHSPFPFSAKSMLFRSVCMRFANFTLLLSCFVWRVNNNV